MAAPPLILASRSPRRRELLAGVGLRFTLASPDIDERVRRGESPRAYVVRLAREKARAVHAHDGATVLAADTSVVVDGKILGKPRDRADAARMIKLLSGRAHDVFTGVAVRRGKKLVATAARTRVTFRALTPREIAWYVRLPEPYDKAGGYAIQGAAGGFITKISGSASNVIGLPLHTALKLLARVGFPLPWSAP
ncbi:MAG: septum formation inhibitor Maf [Deltaproteobacteria bacterium]|nr:septum formation inhibitor Maf [Deltaproteobacteria bacterium]